MDLDWTRLIRFLPSGTRTPAQLHGPFWTVHRPGTCSEEETQSDDLIRWYSKFESHLWIKWFLFMRAEKLGDGTLALALWNWSSLFSSSSRSDCFSCSSSVTRFCSLRVSEVSIPRVTSCMMKETTEQRCLMFQKRSQKLDPVLKITSFFLFVQFLTSPAREPSSGSVYSDSLLLWVESVLLWPGLEMFCKHQSAQV